MAFITRVSLRLKRKSSYCRHQFIQRACVREYENSIAKEEPDEKTRILD
jgi:hypothetical protein